MKLLVRAYKERKHYVELGIKFLKHNRKNRTILLNSYETPRNHFLKITLLKNITNNRSFKYWMKNV